MSEIERDKSLFDTDSHRFIDNSERVYANAEQAESLGRQVLAQRGDSSDEVDPRKLNRDPTLSEIRWYYRRTFAKVLVDKPIDDAFKNSFEFIGNNANEADTLINEPSWEGEGRGFEGAYRYAEKQARRDGFSLLFIGTRDDSDGPHVSPIDEGVNVQEITHLKSLTVDDLTESAAPHPEIKEGTGLDIDQYDVRETGIVVNTDITSPDYRTPVGYVLSGQNPQFIHADRILHYTWNPEVSGDYGHNNINRHHDDTLGMYEGDSVLIPTYNLLKGLVKGNWSIMQALFRNAANMYAVFTPNDVTQEEFDGVVQQTTNINAKSSFTFPTTEYEMEQFESGNQMEPTDHYEVIFDQVCAGHEMTKSVLFGTQAGTVSGSEVDIKNYFNKVERFRSNRGMEKIMEYLNRVKRMKDTRTSNDFHFDVDIEWGPLFKVDEETRVRMLQVSSQALATAIGRYVVTPDEAREILSSQFSEIDLDGLTEQQWDALDRIQFAEVSQPAASEAAEASQEGREENAEAGNQGGRPEGSNVAQENPTGSGNGVDSLESVIDDDALLDAVAEKIAAKKIESDGDE